MGMKFESNLKEAGAYAEVEKHQKHAKRTIIATVIVAVLSAVLAIPTYCAVLGDFDAARLYFEYLAGMALGEVPPLGFLKFYFFDWPIAEYQATGFPPFAFIGALALPIFVYAAGTASNKHRKTPNIFGDARWASESDIEEMGRRNLIGFEDSKKSPKDLFVLGKFKGRLLKMGETLSTLILAPPGTGKSVAFIVPSIVEMDHASLMIHDSKPELWDMTSGYRSAIGRAFQIRWAAQDEPDGRFVTPDELGLLNPDLIELDAQGKPIRDAFGNTKTKPIFYPSWNPLSPKCLPPVGPKRDMYLDRLSNTLCPDGAMGDKFWTSKARAALTGLAHFLCAKVEAAREFDAGWDGIPAQWQGREASFPMLVDWFAEAQAMTGDGDPMAEFMKGAINEAKRLDDLFEEKTRTKTRGGIRPMNRAIVEMSSLMSSPDKTRGSILTTFDDAMAPFKMESVRQRTSYCDIAFYELRGMPTEVARKREEERVRKAKAEGAVYKPRYEKHEWVPVSVYISVDLDNAKAFAPITSIFIDSANAYLVSNGPQAIDEQGNQNGPYAFGFMIDEAPQLNKLETVINGPAVGRSKKVFYAIVGQDFGQFEQKYSKAEVETLKSTTAIKVILAQNNETTAKAISEMAGGMTFSKQSFSDKPRKGIEGFLKGPGKSASESLERVEFLRPSFLMSMPEGQHVVLVQNYMNRPILANSVRYFMETGARKGKKAIAQKALNLVTMKGPPPAPPMDIESMASAALRQVDLDRRRETAIKLRKEADAQKEAAETQSAQPSQGAAAQGAPSAPAWIEDRVLLVTPGDIQSLRRDEDGRPVGGTVEEFAIFHTRIGEFAEFVEMPDAGRVIVVTSPHDVKAEIGDKPFYVFNRANLDRYVNGPLLQAGLQPINAPGQANYVAELAEELNERSIEDLYCLGANGGALLDPAQDPSAISSQWAMAWMADVLTYCLDMQMKMLRYDGQD